MLYYNSDKQVVVDIAFILLFIGKSCSLSSPLFFVVVPFPQAIRVLFVRLCIVFGRPTNCLPCTEANGRSPQPSFARTSLFPRLSGGDRQTPQDPPKELADGRGRGWESLWPAVPHLAAPRARDGVCAGHWGSRCGRERSAARRQHQLHLSLGFFGDTNPNPFLHTPRTHTKHNTHAHSLFHLFSPLKSYRTLMRQNARK